MTGATKSWRCSVCGYIHQGDAPPEQCPVCGAPASAFEPFEPPAKPAVESAAAKPAKWRCMVCGYVHEGDAPPLNCPACGAGADCFEPILEPVKPAPQVERAGKVLVAGAGIAGISAVEAVLEIAPGSQIVLLSREKELPYYRLNLTRLVAGEINEDALPIHPQSWYDEHAVHLRLGIEASSLDTEKKTVELSDGSKESYDKLILTAGSHAFVPPIPGAQRAGVMSFRTMEDARRILAGANSGAKCVCIGGGILGLETAGGLANRGVDVTVIEGSDWLMPRQLSERGGRLLQRHIEEIGVKIVTSARTVELTGNDHVRGVSLDDERVIDADLVIMSTGVRPNSHLAIAAGLDVNRGIIVDNYLHTSRPNVYAAGDVTEHRGVVYGIWPASQYQGKIAGMNAAGISTEFAGIPPSNTLKVLHVEVVSIGKIEPEDGSWQVIEEERDDAYTRFLFRDTCLAGAVMVGDTSSAAAAREAIEGRKAFSAVLRKGAAVRDVVDALAR